MLLKKALVFIFCVPFLFVRAQQFGGNPPFIKWKQVNNATARVIFPRGLDSIAMNIAGITQQLDSGTRFSIGDLQRKINIVLQNQTTISNAYVALGPFRSEFYLTPLQNSFALGSLPWYEQLAIHEYRHVQQDNNFNVGLSKAFRVVFGEEGQALANNLVIPDWFYEGDAVYNETVVSRQGRGRLPYFFNGFRSLWEAERNYSWMKLRNGSLRDYTPDHYQLGYLLAAYGREKYGEDFWKKVTGDAASFKGLFYPFQKAVKRYSGLTYRQFRKAALDNIAAQVAPANSGAPRPSLPQHRFESREFPAFTNDGKMVYVKSGYRQLPAITISDGKQEFSRRVKDVSIDNHFSYRNGNIVYASYRPDTRWGWRDYSEIRILNLETGKQKTVTRKTRYFSPDISEDGSIIVAVHVEPGGRSALHFLDAGNGMLIKALPNEDKLFYTYPRFYSANQVISAVRDTVGRMALALTDGASGTTEYLTPFSFNVIGFPSVSGDTVYFSAAHEGEDRLFALVVPGKQLYQPGYGGFDKVTGYYQPVAGSGSFAWTRFSAGGYQLGVAKASEMNWQRTGMEKLTAPPPRLGLSDSSKTRPYFFTANYHLPVTAYPGSTRLVNFHSLRPLADDPVYSFSLVGENVLNTLQSELFFNYNRSEKYKQAGFNATYAGWFPWVSGGINYTMDRRGLYHGKRIYWNELELQGGMKVPLNLSKGRYFRGLTAGANYVFNQPGFRGVYKDSLGNQSFSYVNSTISFFNQVQKTRQQIYPRFAQTVMLNYKKAVSNFDARQLLAAGSLYLPGLFTNHHLVLTGAVQGRDSLHQRSYTNNFPFSRGYTSENFYRMSRWGANYHFPLFYPDAGFGNIVYLLRVRSNLFYDHTRVKDFTRNKQVYTSNFRSVGTEIFFDTKWWNELPLSFGMRFTRLLDEDLFGATGRNRFELVLPVNLLDR